MPSRVVHGVRQILVGPRGGQHYISASGKKVYRIPVVALHPQPPGAARGVRFSGPVRSPGQREALAGLALVNKLHTAFGMPPIRMEMVKGLREKHGLVSGFDAKNNRILFDADHPHTRYSAVQMFAHALDYHALSKKVGVSGKYGTLHDYNNDPLSWAMDEDRSHAALRPWKQAIVGSERFAKLVTLGAMSPHTRAFADKLSQPHILFSQSYAKWVAERSGDPALKAQIAARVEVKGKTGARYPMDWGAEDFKPIAAAFDETFAALGWRKGRE